MARTGSAVSALRGLWRRARAAPVIGSVLSTADRAWWLRTIMRSGLVDGRYYAAQRGRSRGGNLAAAVHYVVRGFRAGLSPNPLFDELFAARDLPDLGRVPALYAYLVSDRVSVRVHPWWVSTEYARRNGVSDGALEHAWRHRSSARVEADVAGRRREFAVTEWRRLAIDAVRLGRLGSAPAAPVSVIRILQGEDRHHDAKIRSAVDAAVGAAVHLTAVGVGPSAWSSVAIAVHTCEAETRVSAVRMTSRTTFAEVVQRAAVAAGDGVVVVLDPRISPSAGDIARLAATGARAMVSPAVIAIDGTLASIGAGIVETPVGPRATRVLTGHPAEDIARLGAEEVAVPLLSGRTFACPAPLLRRVARSPLAPGWELEVASARVRGSDDAVPVLVDASVVVGCFADERAFANAATPLPPELAAAGSDSAILNGLHERAGFDVTAWEERSAAEAVPRLRRRDGRQRWAIKTSAPAGPSGEAWGDVHFARGLAAALGRLGHDVVLDSRSAANRATTYLDDVHLVVRGPFRIVPPRGGVRIEWIISHPDEIVVEEVSDFDLVYAVSAGWAQRAAAEWGRNVGHLLEATDTDLFQPGSAPRNRDLVFVGTARGIPRPSVVAPITAGIDVKVYGPDWRGFIPPRAIVAAGIPNSELPGLYGAAGAVLNDQWPAMRREGFIAMRPFDVVAAGGRVISESVTGLREIFGEALVEYDTTQHLLDLLKEDLDSLFPTEERLAEIAERIRAEHSFDARAAVLDRAVRKFAGTVPVQ